MQTGARGTRPNRRLPPFPPTPNWGPRLTERRDEGVISLMKRVRPGPAQRLGGTMREIPDTDCGRADRRSVRKRAIEPIRMNTTSLFSPSLGSLFSFLDALNRRATVEELVDKLGSLDITYDDVAPWVRFSGTQYLRNLIRSGPTYHALAICWRSGQRSPIHNHAQSTCGVRVLKGTATETLFDRSPGGLLKAVSSADLQTGGVTASADSDTHQVSNLQVAGDDLVTLHVYSPPLLRMDTYSLTDARIGEFRPMVLEQSQGAGI